MAAGNSDLYEGKKREGREKMATGKLVRWMEAFAAYSGLAAAVLAAALSGTGAVSGLLVLWRATAVQPRKRKEEKKTQLNHSLTIIEKEGEGKSNGKAREIPVVPASFCLFAFSHSLSRPCFSLILLLFFKLAAVAAVRRAGG
jgi:hypothetical protein